MKIEINQLIEGQKLVLSESENIADLDILGVKSISPLDIKAGIIKIGDTLVVDLDVKAKFLVQCCRCLNETEKVISKRFRLDYPLPKQEKYIDITEDIRQELVVDYPLKPLCGPLCKGLCLKCGRNLNEGACGCK